MSTSPEKTPPEKTPPEETPPEELLAETRRALLHRLATGQAEGRTPSLVGAVIRDGQPVWSHGRGLVDGRAPTADTQYRIGSITKTFVAVLVMRLRDEGLLDLADPLDKHLPGTPVGQRTITELLAHTAGLAAEAAGDWWERTPGALRPELGDTLGEQPVRHPAGRRFHYSNPGFALLGALVARRRGQPWEEVLRREVLEPLGMPRTTMMPEAPHARGWAVHPWADVLLPEPAHDAGHMAPAGQLWSTAADLCRFAAFLSAGDARVLHPDSVAEMRTAGSAPEANSWDSGYGLGMQVLRSDGRMLAGHTGSMPGFLAALWVSVDEGVGAVTLTNRTFGLSIGALTAELLGIVTKREPRIPAPWEPLPEVHPELLELTGPWYWGPVAYAVRLRAERTLELGPVAATDRQSRFRPAADGTWVGQDGYGAGEPLRVVRGADGAVSHLDVGGFVFTRAPYEDTGVVPGGVDPDGWRAGPT